MPSRQGKNFFEQINGPILFLIGVLGFLGGTLSKGYNMASNVVTQDQLTKAVTLSQTDLTKAVTELKSAVEGQKKYIDDRASEALEKAVNHSDNNRLQTLNDMKGLASDVSAIKAKQDLMFDAIRQLQQNQQQQIASSGRK